MRHQPLALKNSHQPLALKKSYPASYGYGAGYRTKLSHLHIMVVLNLVLGCNRRTSSHQIHPADTSSAMSSSIALQLKTIVVTKIPRSPGACADRSDHPLPTHGAKDGFIFVLGYHPTGVQYRGGASLAKMVFYHSRTTEKM